MAIEKSYPGELPVSGLEPSAEDAEMEAMLDIQLPDEEGDMGEDMPNQEAPPVDHYENLAERMDTRELRMIGKDLVADVEADFESMSEWEQILTDGLKLLGFKLDDREAEVFPDSCTVAHPLLAESIVKYQAKARSQILRPEGTARTKILGRADPVRKAQAERIKEFTNYQIQELMPEYGPEHDRMLFHQAFAGSAYTKLFYDTALGRPVSRFVAPLKFIIDYNATNLESAYRYAEVLDLHANDLRRYQLDGFYTRVALTEQGDESDGALAEEIDSIAGRVASDADDTTYQLYEVHTYLALEGEVDDRTQEEAEIGLELPYIITVDSNSGNILAIRRNWKEGDQRYAKRLWYTHWPFIPGLGFQGYGYVHLIGGLSRTASSSLRQLIDAGSFATLQGGFKAHGMRVIGNNEPIQPGEWRDVQAPGMDLSKALQPLPYKEPSPTLMNLLVFITEAAQKFADSTEQVVSESTNYGPVGTTMALLEASGRLFSGIHERLFESQKRELMILMEINSETLPDKYPFPMAGGEQVIASADFDARLDVIPVTDPREPTAAHRVARANATLSVAGQFPKEHNLPAVLEDLHSALGSEDPARYLTSVKPPPPMDPVTENANLIKGTPAKAYLEENHMAHIKVHMMIIDNPMYSQNPQSIQAVMAHVQDHLAMQYTVEMMQQGVELPKPQNDQIPPEQAEQMKQKHDANNAIAVQAAEAADKIVPQPAEEDLELQVKLGELEVKNRAQDLKEAEAMAKEELEKKTLAQEDSHHKDDIRVDLLEMDKDRDIAKLTKNRKET